MTLFNQQFKNKEIGAAKKHGVHLLRFGCHFAGQTQKNKIGTSIETDVFAHKFHGFQFQDQKSDLCLFFQKLKTI